MNDLISRQQALDAIRKLQTYKLFEGDDMILVDKADVQTELMILPSASPDLSEEDMRLIKKLRSFHNGSYAVVLDKLITSACNETKQQATVSSDLIDRNYAIDDIHSKNPLQIWDTEDVEVWINELPSAEPEKEIPRRVLWSGWKGTRYTRYKCPNCNKPVKNDDVYCHRCGQKLMFPHISHTPYIEGQKQELIVRWDDEE